MDSGRGGGVSTVIFFQAPVGKTQFVKGKWEVFTEARSYP